MAPGNLACHACGGKVDSEDRFCRWCGTPLNTTTPGAPFAGVQPDDITTLETLPQGTPLGSNGRYQVVTPLGKGGFGQAYLAHDTRLSRYCVIKRLVLKPNWSARVQRLALQNFQREAELLVTLNSPGHPNIPEIYEYLPESRCLVMKYIEGKDMEQLLSERGGSLPVTEALTYMREACTALIYMHSREPEAVLHRDIKPANILIDTSERVWVVDFGLSKATTFADEPLDVNQKNTTQIAGTLGYSPAEQWRKLATPRSDVYALAATLHTLLTGYRPKLTKADLPDIFRGKKGAFPPVRTFRKDISPDVEHLILRGMAFDMSSRPDAQGFLDEINAILAPAATRLAIQTPDGASVGTDEELVAWCEHHWPQAVLWLYDKDSMIEQIERIWGQNQLANALRADVQTHFRDQDAGLDAVLARLDPDNFGSEKPRLVADRQAIDYGALPSDGRSDRSITLRNAGRRYVRAQMRLPAWMTTGTPILSLIPEQSVTTTLTANMRRVTSGGHLRDQVLIHNEVGLLRRIQVQAMVSRWRTLLGRAIGSNRGGVWELIDTLKPPGSAPWSVAFSPNRHLLASGGGDGSIRLWRVNDGKLLQTFTGHLDTVMTLAFSPDGQVLLSGSADCTMKFWDVSDGTMYKSISDHTRSVWSVAYDPFGKLLASGSGDHTIRLWQAEDKSIYRTLTGHRDTVLSVSFSPDGQLLASGGSDNKIWLWRVNDGKLLQTMGEHRLTIWCVAFSPDGQLIASGAGDGLVKLWQADDGAPVRTFDGKSGTVHTVAFSADGFLASGAENGSITIWNQEDGTPQQVLTGHNDSIQRIAFSADGEMLAACSRDGTITLWQLGYA